MISMSLTILTSTEGLSLPLAGQMESGLETCCSWDTRMQDLSPSLLTLIKITGRLVKDEILQVLQICRPDVWYYNGGEKPVLEILWRYPNLVHNEKMRLGVTTNVAWFFYVNPKKWDPKTWLSQYDTLHLLIGHRKDIDPRYPKCQNIKRAQKSYLIISDMRRHTILMKTTLNIWT